MGQKAKQCKTTTADPRTDDQKLYEDETVNRMQEAMELFGSVENIPFVTLSSTTDTVKVLMFFTRWFDKTSIILFLNKIDLFRAKLPTSPLHLTFPEYQGGSNYEAACAFLLEKFVGLNQKPTKSIYAVSVYIICLYRPDRLIISLALYRCDGHEGISLCHISNQRCDYTRQVSRSSRCLPLLNDV